LRFGGLVVLEAVTFAVEPAELFALIGPNGAGKTSVLNCIGGIYRGEGRISFRGEGIVGRTPRAVARLGVARTFQHVELFPHMSVLDNITLAPRVVHGVDAGVARTEATALLHRIGLADKADSYPDKLSGGQQQRAAIARAIAVRPRVLLLDEVTSALDPELVGEVLSLVRELAGQGMTILMATHEMGFAKQVADTVCFLDQGVVLESGPPNQVLGAPTQARTRQFLARVVEAGRL